MASNTGTLADEDGEFTDWIEIHNAGPGLVHLDGWFLTDSASQLMKWRFPNTNLASGSFLLTFASNKDRTTPGSNLHTKVIISEIMYRPPDLGSEDNVAGEFIELVNISSEAVALFDPLFPTNSWRLSGGISYAFPANQTIAPGEVILLVSFDPRVAT